MGEPQLVRWGSSPYERPEGLTLEAKMCRSLGVGYRAEPQGSSASVLGAADVLVVTSLTRVGGAELDRAPRCRLLVTTTSGYDHLDLQAAAARGIAVARMPLARRDAVVESSLAMGLSMLRGLPVLQHAARQDHWARRDLPELGMVRVADDPVGVVGLGVIGQRMAALLQAMGAEVLGHDPAGVPAGVEPVEIPEMLQRCRLVSLHCRLEPGAPPAISGELLRGARSDLGIVNTSRGGVLDLTAALSLLESEQLGGLALDVFPREPWPGLGVLAQHPRVLLTPHAAGYHPELHVDIASELQAVLVAWLDGQPIPARLV